MHYKCILDEAMYLPRTLEHVVAQAAEQFPVLMVCGPRQVGKTTLLQMLAEGSHRYVTLDDPLALQLALEDGALFLQRYAPPVLIDEVQYAPNLLPLIKLAVDQSRRPGEFWLTGSQPFHLMQGVAESLAGRVAVMHLQGLSVAEAQGRGGAHLTSVGFFMSHLRALLMISYQGRWARRARVLGNHGRGVTADD
jgi:predicted AAA+ superfamily ATPase